MLKPASQDIWTVSSKFVPFAITAKVKAAMKELENEDNNLKPQFPVYESKVLGGNYVKKGKVE